MQIFIPFADVIKSLRCLDRKRLFSQLREALQCLATIKLIIAHQQDPTNVPFPAYGNHPAARSWKESVRYLTWYACKCSEIIRETLFTKAGVPYKTECWDNMLRTVHGGWISEEPVEDKPAWWGTERIHASYRGMLYRKNPEHYSQFSAEGKLYDDYVWPVPLLSVKSKRSRTECPWAPRKAVRPTEREGLLHPVALSFSEIDTKA